MYNKGFYEIGKKVYWVNGYDPKQPIILLVEIVNIAKDSQGIKVTSVRKIKNVIGAEYPSGFIIIDNKWQFQETLENAKRVMVISSFASIKTNVFFYETPPWEI